MSDIEKSVAIKNLALSILNLKVGLVELKQRFNYAGRQPRHPKGSPHGGQFAPKGGSGGGARDFKDLDSGLARSSFEQAHELGAPLNNDILESLVDYQSNNYLDINRLARGAPPPPLKGARKKEIRQQIKDIDLAIESSPRLKDDLWVYRGVSLKSLEEITKPGVGRNKGEILGGVIKDKGFSSFTLDKKIALDFSSGKEKGAVMLLRLPKGSKGLLMNSHLKKHTGPSALREHEILLPRRSTFLVTQVLNRPGEPTVLVAGIR